MIAISRQLRVNISISEINIHSSEMAVHADNEITEDYSRLLTFRVCSFELSE